MPKFTTFILFLFCVSKGFGTHIVGGNFEISYISPEYYRINLQFYFDDINGIEDAKDDSVLVSFFDKETNRFLSRVYIPIINEKVSPTLNNDCYSTTKIRTRFITYSKLVKLSKSLFIGNNGYYAVYERCCRNKIIQNIINPDASGMTFYIEQPYANNLNNSQQFINNSPIWAPPTQFYACKDQLLNLDFKAKDSDGDSLVYFMENPVAGYSSSSNPRPNFATAAPYPIVNFKNGYSKNNAIRGNPALNIDSETGNLSVRPLETGLFVFAIVCLEYRKGVQIGKINREIQMLVWDCPKYTNSTISGSNLGKVLKEFDTLFVEKKLGLCANLFVNDTDTNAYVYTFATVPKELSNNYTSTLSQGYTKDTLKGKFCLKECIEAQKTIFPIQIRATKYICSQSITDTFNYFVKIIDTIKTPAPLILGTIEKVKFKNNDTLKIIRKTGGCINIKVTDKESNTTIYTEYNLPSSITSDYTFSLQGQGKASDTLNGDFCILKCANISPPIFKIQIRAFKTICQDTINDTLNFYISVVDTVYVYEFKNAPNIFTPNGDDKNDLFFLKDIPEDNCDEKFIRFEILNRWGNVVYTSTDKNFTWDAKNIPDGQYYYYVIFEKKQFKGIIQVLR